MSKSSIFIGSSTEGLEIARAIQFQLSDDTEATIWTEGFFELGRATLETLVNSIERFDFAIIVLTPDDLILSKNASSMRPRDNVMFELGLFMGRLGRSRTFMISDSQKTMKLPSDLAGVTIATYDSTIANKVTAVGPACYLIRNTVKDLGEFEGKTARQLHKATRQVEDISETVATLVYLLARSRTVELDIIKTQFGFFIDSEFLEKIQNDLVELQASVGKKDKPSVPVTSPGRKRVAGLHRGAAWVSEDFDEPLPDEFWLGSDE